MTVQQTDQMSARRPCPACLMIFGALQYGVPLMDFCPETAGRCATGHAYSLQKELWKKRDYSSSRERYGILPSLT